MALLDVPHPSPPLHGPSPAPTLLLLIAALLRVLVLVAALLLPLLLLLRPPTLALLLLLRPPAQPQLPLLPVPALLLLLAIAALLLLAAIAALLAAKAALLLLLTTKAARLALATEAAGVPRVVGGLRPAELPLLLRVLARPAHGPRAAGSPLGRLSVRSVEVFLVLNASRAPGGAIVLLLPVAELLRVAVLVARQPVGLGVHALLAAELASLWLSKVALLLAAELAALLLAELALLLTKLAALLLPELALLLTELALLLPELALLLLPAVLARRLLIAVLREDLARGLGRRPQCQCRRRSQRGHQLDKGADREHPRRTMLHRRRHPCACSMF